LFSLWKHTSSNIPLDHAGHTRRTFLSSLLALPTGLWLSQRLGSTSSVLAAPAQPKVILAKRTSVLKGGDAVEGRELRELLDRAIIALTGKSDARSAWKSLCTPADVVGIKVNCLAGRGASSHPEVASAIVEGLASADIPRKNIIVWDRTEHDLLSAGFSMSGLNGAKVLATDSRGIGYEPDVEFAGEVGSCFSRIISRMCTAIISVPMLKDHDLAGVSLGMKNFYGAIHNPNKYHDNNCTPFVADLSTHPFIKNKLRLIVCDGLMAQYHGGPAPRPQWAWPAATLLVGTDPVAVDRIGCEMIERKRKEAGMKPLKESGREPKYIETAETRGLGVADLGKIMKISIS
jgi:uncharacterized protein (DUF362 family)